MYIFFFTGPLVDQQVAEDYRVKIKFHHHHHQHPKGFCQQMYEAVVQVLVETVGGEMLDEIQPHERNSDVVEDSY